MDIKGLEPATRDERLILFKGMRKRISAPKRWIQGSYSGVRDEDGHLTTNMVAITAEGERPANCWCLLGAMYATLEEIPGERRGVVLRAFIMHRAVMTRSAGYGIVTWQDAPERTYEEVSALLDELVTAP